MEVLQHDLPEGEVLAAPFHRMDMERMLSLAQRSMRDRKRLQHSDINVAKLIQMRKCSDLAHYVRESDIICVDGAGVMMGCRLLGIEPGGRVTGIDLMMRSLDLCEREGFRPYFLGARQSVVETMIQRLGNSHPDLKIAGFRNGYFGAEDEAGIVAEIRNSKADCLFVGITSPIKERFLHDYRDAWKCLSRSVWVVPSMFCRVACAAPRTSFRPWVWNGCSGWLRNHGASCGAT